MILWIETRQKNRKPFEIHKLEDFDPLYAMFPMIRRAILSSDTLIHAAKIAARYISSSGRLRAWVDERSITKIIKREMLKQEEEEKPEFSDSFSKWIKEREKEARKRQENRFESQDPGRQRVDDTEYDKLKDSKDPMDKIRFAIKDAKRNNENN